MRDANDIDLPVRILSYDEYAPILAKTITAGLALSAYYNAGYPLSTLSLWPVVTGTAYRIVIWSWKPLTSFTSLSDSVSLAPGYEDYIESNLTVRCCMAFARPVPAEIAEWAITSKAKLKRININIPTLGLPTFLTGSDGGTFPISPHIYTGY